MRRRASIVKPAPHQVSVAAKFTLGDADLLARVIARRAASFNIHSFDEWVSYHLQRDAQALGISSEAQLRERLSREFGVAPAYPRDSRGRFVRHAARS